MNHENVKDGSRYEAGLRKLILEVRYTDIEEEMRLCKELLGIAEPRQDNYNCAFAHVYLIDSVLALGDYRSCNFHLIRAKNLCKKFGYDDLMLSLCNLAGLYYLKLNDEQTAIEYYLKGLRLSEELNNFEMRAKLSNNTGLAFASRDDWQTAKRYFEEAFRCIEPYVEQDVGANAISYLSNLAESCKQLGDGKGMQAALLKCEALSGAEANQYQKIRLGAAWASYYAEAGDKENCLNQLEQTLTAGLLEYDNKFFMCDMLEGLCENMLDIGEREKAKMLLDILTDMETDAALINQYRIELLKIRYWEASEEKDEHEKALRKYYELVEEMSGMDDDARVQSMMSKIEITKARLDQQATHSENQKLERISQLDELTGLFNRRYLNKLITKTLQRKDIVTIGYIMLDVDFFKQYNDFYGHFKGDKALKAVAQTMAENVTDGFFAGRYGGDEFICLCVNCTDEQINQYAQQVYCGLAQKKIDHEKSGCSSRLTLSIGYSNRTVDAEFSAEKILALADQALYEAKEAGRNRIAKL